MRKPKKWPSYALEALETSLILLAEIEGLSREAQRAAKENDRLQAVIINGDIRERAARAREHLVRAKIGEYENSGLPCS